MSNAPESHEALLDLGSETAFQQDSWGLEGTSKLEKDPGQLVERY